VIYRDTRLQLLSKYKLWFRRRLTTATAAAYKVHNIHNINNNNAVFIQRHEVKDTEAVKYIETYNKQGNIYTLNRALCDS